jgi:hypothetical protein
MRGLDPRILLMGKKDGRVDAHCCPAKSFSESSQLLVAATEKLEFWHSRLATANVSQLNHLTYLTGQQWVDARP